MNLVERLFRFSFDRNKFIKSKLSENAILQLFIKIEDCIFREFAFEKQRFNALLTRNQNARTHFRSLILFYQKQRSNPLFEHRY